MSRKSSTATSPRAEGRQRGASLVALLASVTIMLIGMTMAMPTWRFVNKQDNEEELVFRGFEIVKGIRAWSDRQGGTFPINLKQMVDAKVLRREYADPMTSAKWTFVDPQKMLPVCNRQINIPGMPGTDGVVPGSGGGGSIVPGGGFNPGGGSPPQSGPGRGGPQGIPSPSPNPGGTPGPTPGGVGDRRRFSEGPSLAPVQRESCPRGARTRAERVRFAAAVRGIRGRGPAGAVQQPDALSVPPQLGPGGGSRSGEPAGPPGQETGTTGTTGTNRDTSEGVMGSFNGVISKSTDESLGVFNGKNHYNEWCFSVAVIDPSIVSLTQLKFALMRLPKGQMPVFKGSKGGSGRKTGDD